MRKLRFILAFFVVSLFFCIGCGNKEVPVETWESTQFIENTIENEELSQQESVENYFQPDTENFKIKRQNN